MGANKVSLKKTLLCVATVPALTMIAGGAAAATNEYSLQYNGIGVKAEYADYASEHSHFFIGGNFVNHGPTEKESGDADYYYNAVDRYGDHTADPNNVEKYNTIGDISLTYTESTFRNAIADETLAAPKDFEIYGGGLVFGSVSSGDQLGGNQANVKGDVNLVFQDITTRKHENDEGLQGFVVFGGGAIHTNFGRAILEGNTHITLKNVNSPVSEVMGGGLVNGGGLRESEADPYRPKTNADASVKGNVTIDVSDSTLGTIAGGGDVTGDGTTTDAKMNIEGDVTINVKNTTLKLGGVDFDYGVVVGGSFATQKGVANLEKGVTINVQNSTMDLLIGGGGTADELYPDDGDRVSVAGHSAVVKGDVNITLDGTAVSHTLLAGGYSDSGFFGIKYNPQDGEYGDADVKGNATVTLKNGSSVKTVYMAGYGKDADVEGDSTLIIVDPTVKVLEGGVIYGQGAVVDGAYTSTTRSSTLAFGTQDQAYVGDFKAAFQDFDVVTASKNSVVNLGVIDNDKHGRVTEKGTESWLKFSGAGTFVADIDISNNNNLWINTAFNAKNVKVNGAQITIGKGGTLTAENLGGTGSILIQSEGVLSTTSNQIFKNALHADGLNIDPGALKYNGLVFEGGTLTLTDGKYNIVYAKNAQSILNTGKLEFTGTLVDITGEELPNLDLDKTPEDVTLGGTDLNATADQNGTVTVDKTVGGKTLVVDGGTKVTVSQDKTLTLVGGADASGELIKFKDAAGDKTVTASGEKGGVMLGSESDQKTGTLSATVNLTQKATLTAQNGAFTVEAVKAQDANVAVNSGELIVNKLEMSGMSAISSNATGKTKVAELSFGKDGTTTVTGAVSADKIVALSEGNATINIGKTGEDGERGDLTIDEGSIKGLTFFLDPTWVDGQEVTDASRLVLNQTTLDGNVIVGENSYVVLGTDTDADFVKLFADKTLTWGKGEGKTLAAAYVAKPIDVTAGSLVVDGTLTSAPANEAAGTVKFAAGSVLVADVTDLTTDKALITGTTFDVDAASKAVIIGQLKNGETYKLTTDADSKFWNTEKTLVAGNKLWDFTVNEDGSFTTKLTDAALVYGDLMQGHELANAATEAGNAYGNELLTETEGLSNAAIAARFDAAMNTAGAAAVFTTAYDRASELRDAVRGEALEGEGNRLWAQVTGGKTKLNGLSSGAQSIHVDTDAYGLVVGGDVALSNGVLGAAFTAGTGDSENDDVGVKDDFDFYGLSVYGKTSVGGIDLLADGSMTFVKSDLTMGGVADVDTDTTTAVYSLGVQAQRTWDYVVAITPFVGMDIYHVRGDGYDNGHGAQVDDAHATAVEFPIGATIAKAFETNGFKLSPNFSFAVVPTVGDRDIDSKVRFAGAESTYNFTFADDVKVRTNLGFAAEKDNFRFGLNAGYDWGNEERSATKLMLNAQYRF